METENGFALVHGASPAPAIDLPGRGERSGQARAVGMEAPVEPAAALERAEIR